MTEILNYEELKEYLKPTYFIDSDNETVIKKAESIVKDLDDTIKKATVIFYWTRDKIKYEPYESFTSRKVNYKASKIIKAGKGWCVQKACVLAALARAVKIPSRLHFADIVNHQVSEKLKDIMGTNLFVFHGYTELYLNNKWIKATPAFNIELCEKFGLKPVEFDGINDSILPEYTLNGEKHIEYVRDRGTFSDFPFDLMFKTMRQYYKFV
ncbi:MAG: transglutaminase-like domain-containing protein [Candidatus Helarchaeota archaeon]